MSWALIGVIKNVNNKCCSTKLSFFFQVILVIDTVFESQILAHF